MYVFLVNDSNLIVNCSENFCKKYRSLYNEIVSDSKVSLDMIFPDIV
jgi:hypothetical protein